MQDCGEHMGSLLTWSSCTGQVKRQSACSARRGFADHVAQGPHPSATQHCYFCCCYDDTADSTDGSRKLLGNVHVSCSGSIHNDLQEHSSNASKTAAMPVRLPLEEISGNCDAGSDR